jgi:hypothetical protein
MSWRERMENIICDCIGAHDRTCRWAPVVWRYDRIWERAYERYVRRSSDCLRRRRRGDLKLRDEARRLQNRINHLRMIVGSPEALRQVIRLMEEALSPIQEGWKETRR